MSGPRSHPLLVTGSDADGRVAVLAGVAVDLTRRSLARAHPLRTFVIDRSDRSLIRLRQLTTTVAYLTIDDLSELESMIDSLEANLGEVAQRRLDLLVVNDMERLLSFVARSGRADLARRLGELVARHDGSRLMVAAACSAPELLPHTVREQFGSQLDCNPGGQGRLVSPTGEQIIDLREWPTDHLTDAIAAMVKNN